MGNRRISAMRSIAALTAGLLVAGCQQSPPPQAQAPTPSAQAPPAPPPAAPVTGQAAAPAPVATPEPAKDRFPLDQKEFEEGAKGKTREQVHEKFGKPDELGEWGPSVGWDGPISIYRGPFTSGEGEKAKARVYFRKSGKDSVAAMVEFTNE
jgi:hypothetical protein